MQHSPARASEVNVMSSPCEYLAFALGSENYGIDIQSVQEIRSYEAPTQVANAPASLKGVINLRGVIVPVIDLRLKFRVASPGYGPLTVVIILNLRGHVVGMVVAIVDVLIDGDLRPADLLLLVPVSQVQSELRIGIPVE